MSWAASAAGLTRQLPEGLRQAALLAAKLVVPGTNRQF